MVARHKNRPYTLEPYNPAWKDWFADIAAEITPWFGDNLLRIDHIGSTAIACADMWAKPNIDLCVTIKDLEKIPTLYSIFTAHGYTPLGREYVSDGDEYVVKDNPETGQRDVSIHIYEAGHPKPASYRAFRDYLITHDDERARYIALKKELHAAHTDAYQLYDTGKTELIEDLKTKATAWASGVAENVE